VTGAASYDIDLEAMAEGAVDYIPKMSGTKQPAFTSGRLIKSFLCSACLNRRMRLQLFYQIVEVRAPEHGGVWKGIEEAAKSAVQNSGNTYTYGRFKLAGTVPGYASNCLPVEHSATRARNWKITS